MNKLKDFLMTAGLCLAAPSSVLALPDGPTVIHGNVQFNGSGANMQIMQGSQNAIINWNGFSIDRNELVQFLQQNSNSSVLNRVTGGLPSSLLGSLQANGKVFLLNPNGIFVGPQARIDTGSFLASTLSMSNEDFLSGKINLKQDQNHNLASVVNQGEIRVADGGFFVLVAPPVSQ